MRLPATFSKIGNKLMDAVGYDREKQPRTDAQIVLDLRTRVEEAHAHAQDRNREIVEWREYINGDGQKDKFAEELRKLELEDSFVVTNFTRALISHLISLLTASLGTPYVVPFGEDPALKKAADGLTSYLQALRHRDNHTRHMRRWFEDAAVCGVGWLRAFYDPWKEEVFLRRQDAATVYPEPNAKTVDECEFIGIRHVYNVGYARRLYPDLDMKKAEEAGPPEQAEEGRGSRRVVKQIEIWEVYHDFGDRLSVYSGDQILYTGEAPITGQGFPLFPFTFIPDNHQLWGYSLLKDVEYLQDFYNRITTRMDWYTRYWANPNVKTDDPNADIETKPGSVWRSRQGFNIDPVHPPDFPSDLFGILHGQQEAMDTITGIQEVNRGQRPEGITAGVALDLLRQASEQRMTGPLEDATGVLGEAANYLLALIQHYYAGSRRAAFDDAGRPEVASVEPTQLRGVYEEKDEETDEVRPVIRPHEYIVLMQPAGDLPRSPAAEAELAIQLYQLGAIDDVALLETVKFDGRKEVLQRKAQQMQAMMEGQAQGMQEGQAQAQQMAAAEAQQQQMGMQQ